MNLTSVKCKILETMLLNDKPLRIIDVAKESGNNFKAVNMHLIGLTKTGYTTSPSKGQYILTQKGKEAVGVSETSKECATQILSQTSNEKAFHFYTAMHKPLNLFACGLKDFSEKIETVDVASLEFHLQRGDFEKWFTNICDTELAKKMELLKATGIKGDQLRTKLQEIIDNRCTALSKLMQS
ncbi:MAG: hypothetical protein ACM3WQ_00410 [Chloroflexota bacterium]